MSAVFLFQYWTDEFLVWDPEDYGGVDKVFLSVENIWRPDVVLYNRYAYIMSVRSLPGPL